MQITPEVLLFPFRSERWKEVFAITGALGLVTTFIPFVMLLFPGYGLRAMRQSIRGDKPTLPTWSDFGQLITDSAWFLLVIFVYSLPSILLSSIVIIFMLLAFMLAPLAMVSNSRTAATAVGTTFVLGWGLGMIAMIIASLISIPLQFLGFIGLTRAVAHNSLKYAFDVRTIWRMARTNFLNFALAFATSYAVYYMVSFLGTALIYTIVCSIFSYSLIGIGLMYASLVGSVMFGLAYRDAQSRFAMAGIIA